MKIIIVGLGQTGTLLAELISKELHDVLVIDEDQEKVQFVTDHYNVSGLIGSGASREILMRAGVDLADVIVALTPQDEINLTICSVAKHSGVRYAIARMEHPDLTVDKEYYAERFQVDYVLSSKRATAREIERHIGLPGTVRAEGFFSTDATLIRVTVESESKLAGMAVSEVRNFMGKDMLVGTVVRGGKVNIPGGRFVMMEGDVVSMIVPNKNLSAIMLKLGLMRRTVKSVLVIGGGDVAYYLADKLVQSGVKVSVLDNDKKRCMELAKLLPGVKVSYADKIDAEVLMEEGIRSCDVCVSLTGLDDTNLVFSMFAWSCGVKSVITKVKSPAYEKLLNRVNIDITISPSVISVDRIISFIRNQAVPNVKGNDIEYVYRIAGGLAEAVEFTAYDNFSAKDVPFKNEAFRLKSDTIIGVIIRDGEVLIPDGNSCIRVGDKVVVLTKRNSRLNVLNDILQ